MSYAELCAFSNFSFLQGASHPQELVRRAAELGYAALALTDECSLAGVVRAHEAALDVGLKLIIGSRVRLQEGDDVVLLAPDVAAYSQLCALVTRGRRRAAKGRYRLTRADLDAVPACIGLWLPGSLIDADSAIWFAALPLAHRALGFAHLLAADSEVRLTALQALADRLHLPLAAVGDVHYHVRERRPLQDILTAIRLHCTVDAIGRAGFANGERCLRPLQTLRRLYPPTLLAASCEIAARCRFRLDQLRYEYPRELVPAGRTAMEHLRALVDEGGRRRWPDGIPAKVAAQIDRELVLIDELGYAHYFLTVTEIVAFARGRGILCQGRGSAANSAVCYALGVTEVDPARAQLLFERFISRERAEPPDIDIDFEHQRREEVIQHIYQRYGRERAALAATVISYRRKSAVRDVGRALGLPPDVIDTLTRNLYWFDDSTALPAVLRRMGLDPDAPLVRHLQARAGELLGFPRHLSQHVGGFVISERPLHTLVPVENAAMPERTIIQWDKDDLEALGLLKIDCLALGMLSTLQRALAMVGASRRRPFELQDIPAEDPATYAMLSRGDSVGVFQVESRAQMSMLPRLKPRCFYDLVIEVAIVRPGPIQGGMVHPYLRRRTGEDAVDYPSEALRGVLERTLGVPLFQEQVMQIAVVAAGFTPGESDQVRRSMAAWQRRGGLEHFRDKLMRGMAERGYDPAFAESLYQQILGFGSYGFPESHAASFALLVYASAWLKCHHPAAFCAALLNSQPMGFYAPAQLVADARRHGVAFLPVDVRQSHWDCTLETVAAPAPAVRLGLRCVAGLAKTDAARLLAARNGAAFVSVNDLAVRAGLSQRAINALAEAGALAALSGDRHAARWMALGVERLPGFLAPHAAVEPPLVLPPAGEGAEIVADYRSLGLTLGRHPLAVLRPRLRRLGARTAEDLQRLPGGRRVRVAGLVTHRQRPGTASGVLFVSLEDETGIANLIVWPRLQLAQRQSVLTSNLMLVDGDLQNAHGVINVVARQVRDLSHLLGRLQTRSRDFH